MSKPYFDFTNFCQSNLPEFYFSQLQGNDLNRVTAFYSAVDSIFQQLHDKISDIYDIIDLEVCPPSFLYQMGRTLGLTEITDLTGSSDDSIKLQRAYIEDTINRLLQKGTKESLIKLLYSINLIIEVQELWTVDFTQYFTIVDYITKNYRNILYYDGSYNYGQPYSTNTWDISNIQTSAGINSIYDYQINNYAFQYLNTDIGLLYFDTYGWEQFSSISYQKIYAHNQYIILLDNSKNLNIYQYDFSKLVYSLNNVNGIDIDYSNNYLIIDYNNILLKYNLTTLIIDAQINKINASNLLQIFNIDNKYVINSTSGFYLWNTNTNSLYNYNIPYTTYNLHHYLRTGDVDVSLFYYDGQNVIENKYNFSSINNVTSTSSNLFVPGDYTNDPIIDIKGFPNSKYNQYNLIPSIFFLTQNSLFDYRYYSEKLEYFRNFNKNNILYNGDFESYGTSGWSVNNGVVSHDTFVENTLDYNSGSLKFATSANVTSGNSFALSSSANMSYVNIGSDLSIDFNYYITSAFSNPISLNLYEYDINSNLLNSSAYSFNTPNSWINYSNKYSSVSTSANNITVKFNSNNPNQTAWLDKIYITSTPFYRTMIAGDKLYLTTSDEYVGNINPQIVKINGFNYYSSYFYKTHYFNVLTNTFQNMDLASFTNMIKGLILLTKPGHTELLNVLPDNINVFNDILLHDCESTNGVTFQTIAPFSGTVNIVYGGTDYGNRMIEYIITNDATNDELFGLLLLVPTDSGIVDTMHMTESGTVILINSSNIIDKQILHGGQTINNPISIRYGGNAFSTYYSLVSGGGA